MQYNKWHKTSYTSTDGVDQATWIQIKYQTLISYRMSLHKMISVFCGSLRIIIFLSEH